MTPRQVEGFANALISFHKRFAPHFRDERQVPWCRTWLHGLLLDGVKKNAAQMSQAVPGGDTQAMQQFLSDSTWACDPIIGELQSVAQQTIGAPDGVFVVDDTGFPKKGDMSVGVKRQYSGTLGKTDNCQIGVCLAYVSSGGHALVDRRLYLPKEWAQDQERRRKAEVPDEVRFQTKPELALEMLRQARRGPLSAQWVTCDDAYGSDGAFRDGVAELGLLYVAEVKSDMKVWTELPTALPERTEGKRGRPRTRAHRAPGAAKPQEVRKLLDAVPKWERIEARPGAKKPVAALWGALRVWENTRQGPGRQSWLLIERPDDDDPKYYFCNAPAQTELVTMAGVAKKEWFVEQCFRDAKQEVGLADYEVRKWPGWHHHITLCLVAAMFLTVVQKLCEKKGFC